MYNQPIQQSSFSASSYGSTPFQSQGQSSYQPVGNVPSVYGQNQQQQYGMNPYANQYHTANYRGNQLGHDAGLRGDSFYPAQQQGGRNYETDTSSFRYGVRGIEQGYNNVNNVSSQFGFNNPTNTAFRSSIPTQQQSFGISNSMSNFAQAPTQMSYSQSAPQSPDAYHTANYRGYQQGHDAGLRGDSFYPAQQQGGQAYEANYGSFRYGVRGNEQGYANVNNVSSQFGFTSNPMSFSGQNFR
jgi:hypothetical protein